MNQTIQTVEGELKFRCEADSIDGAQSALDYYRALGNKAFCTHKNGKHQVYTDVMLVTLGGRS